LKHELWEKEKEQSAKRIEKELGYPVFVKPANLGSSVGVHKVTEQSRLNSALEDAFKYDTKVLVEAAVNAREIEVSVLENPGESARCHYLDLPDSAAARLSACS
jgi:D-alanine-D-alanine ligase